MGLVGAGRGVTDPLALVWGAEGAWMSWWRGWVWNPAPRTLLGSGGGGGWVVVGDDGVEDDPSRSLGSREGCGDGVGLGSKRALALSWGAEGGVWG